MIATTSAAALLLACALLAAQAQAADSAAGAAIFARCRICHTIAASAPSTVGPNLHGIFGRKAGTFDTFPYSAAMKASDITWNERTLARYIRDPKAFIPGNRMAFPGITDDKAIADLIAYLQEASQ